MATRRAKLLASAAIGAGALLDVAHSAAPAGGALYPPEIMAQAGRAAPDEAAKNDPLGDAAADAPAPFAPASSALAAALGPAAFVLRDAGSNEAFRAKIQKAVGRQPVYHSQMSALGEARAERQRARSTLYPQLSTRLQGDYVLKRDFAADTDNVVESLRPRDQFSASISASQLIFDGGAAFQRIKGARARHSEFENSISTRINDLSLAALAAYHDLLTHQALTALGGAYIRRHQKILGDVEERARLGAGSRADVTRALGRLAAARARVAGIRESRRLAEVRYLEFFDEQPGVLTRPEFARVAIASRDAAVAAAAEGNPELAVAAARADASRAEYNLARSARSPEVRVSVDAVKYDVFDGGDDFDVRAGVNVNYNIFGGGARAADIAQAGARARQASYGEAQMRRDIARDAAIAFERREGAEERLAALETALIANDQSRDLIWERYRAGRGDLIDMLQAENDYFEAVLAYLAGLADRDMAVYGLMEHTGDLLRYFSPEREFDGLYDEGRNDG